MKSMFIEMGEEEIFCFPDDGKITCEVYERPITPFTAKGGITRKIEKEVKKRAALSKRMERGVVKIMAPAKYQKEFQEVEPDEVIGDVEGVKLDKAGRFAPQYLSEVVRVKLKKEEKEE